MNTIYGNQRQALLYSYLAGLFDGEGTIVFSKSKSMMPKYRNWHPSYSSKIAIKMTNREAIELFSKTFNGKISYKVSVPNRKLVYGFQKSGSNKIVEILEKLLPYLKVKKKQAEAMIDFLTENKNKHWRHINCQKKYACKICKKSKKIQGYGLCPACYMRMRRSGKISQYKTEGTKNFNLIPDEELIRREDFYQKMKKLNAL